MRLIDADAIPEVSWDQKEEAAFRETINKMPTIEAEPVRLGRWKAWFISETVTYTCRECGFPCNQEYNYCPNCGAVMEG